MKKTLVLLLAVVLTCTWICAGAEAPATGKGTFTFSKAVENLTKVEEVKIETSVANENVPPTTDIGFKVVETSESNKVTQEINNIIGFLGSLMKKPEPTATLEPGVTPAPTPTLEPGATPEPSATPEPPQEAANIIEYFPEEVKQQVEELLPEGVTTEELVGTEAVGVTIDEYEESYGNMTAQFSFATVYEEDQPVVSLMGIIEEAQTEWLPMPSRVKNGGVEITFTPEALVRLKGKEALLVVLSTSMEELNEALEDPNMSPEDLVTPAV